jgi:two-component system cell cycle sensor histidine kinase/response regulator CckA
MNEYEFITLDEPAERAQRFASLGEFTAGVAHDLQAILLPVAEHALALHAEAGGNGAAQARLQQMLDSVELARDLAHQVLRFSHGRAHEHQLLSLGSVVRDAQPLMRAAIANRALLRIAVDAQAPLVQANPVAMQRVLLNLVLNASRAIRQPHGVIEIGVAGMIAADGCGPQFVRLTVADNGIGMDNATVGELTQHLAEPPAASHSAGLGLRIVHQTVSAHGGRLQLDSQPGNGTTVRIDLPAVSQPAVRDNRHPVRGGPT